MRHKAVLGEAEARSILDAAAAAARSDGLAMSIAVTDDSGHPLALLRPRLARLKLQSAQALRDAPHGATVRACGIVTVRQRPGTAKGTIFVTLEDETGPVNVIVWSHVVEAWREPLLKSQLLAVQGTWQRDTESGGNVQHLVAQRFKDLTPWLGRLAQGQRSRDFH